MKTNIRTTLNISPEGKNMLLVAAWFGLVAGLVEALIFVVSIQLGRSLTVWYEIVWISPLVYLVGYSLVGLGLMLLHRVQPRLPVLYFGIAFLTFVTIFDWIVLILTDRVMILAQVMLALGFTTVIMRSYQRLQPAFLRFSHKSVAVLLAFVVLLFIGIQGSMWAGEQIGFSRLSELPHGSPNILVIVVDTLRADHLATYGYERKTSPYIDQLASKGVLFENAYSGSAYSYPSHASLFTGLPLHEHGAEWDNRRALFQLDAPVFPEIFLENGYRTGGFSANTFWVTRKDGFGRGFLRFEDYFTTPLDSVLRTGIGLAFEKLILSRIGEANIPARRLAADINQQTLDWIDKSPGQPFFVFINYMDVHDPYLSPQPYRSMFSTQTKPGGLLNWHIGREYLDLSPEQLQGEIDSYDGSIRYADDQISQLIKELESRGLTDNLLLVILSDHGEAFGEHGVYLHGNSLYREELHVPLIFYWPGHLPAGQRISHPVSINSLGSTLLEMAGLSSDEQFPGPSLASLWQRDSDTDVYPMPLAEIYAKSWFDERSIVKTNSLRSLLNDQWQYIEASNMPEELYNLTVDKFETDNQAGDPDAADVLAEFRAELKSRASTQTKASASLGK